MTSIPDLAEFEQAQCVRFDALRRLVDVSIENANRGRVASAYPTPVLQTLVSELQHLGGLIASFQSDAAWLAERGFPALRNRIANVLPDLEQAIGTYANMIGGNAEQVRQLDAMRREVADHQRVVTELVRKSRQEAIDTALRNWERR